MLDHGAKRLPLLGQIHLGEKRKTFSAKHNKEVEYPAKIDFFLVKPDGHTPQAMADAFHAVFGEKPRELEIVFPNDDDAAIMPVDLSAYRSGVGLWCRGPGQHPDGTPGLATRLYDPEDRTLQGIDLPKGLQRGEMVQVPLCHTERCPYFAGGKDCKLIARLHFMLLDLNGLGVWRITTSSWNSVKNIQGGLEFVRQFTGGRIAGIPLMLRVAPQEVTHEGKKSTVYVLTIAHEQVKLRTLIEASRKPMTDLWLLPEPDPKDIPEAHFPQAVEPDDDHPDAAAIDTTATEAPASPPTPPPPSGAPDEPTAPPPHAARPGTPTAGEPAEAPTPEDAGDADRSTMLELERLMVDAEWFTGKRRAKIDAWRAQGLTPPQMLAAAKAEIGDGGAPAASAPPLGQPPQHEEPLAPTSEAPKARGTRRRAPRPGDTTGTAADPQSPADSPPAKEPERREPPAAGGGRPTNKPLWGAM